ncbi:MAG: phosphoenolpyruvate carboxykinase (ATP), partial [Flavobacteriales bacterium]
MIEKGSRPKSFSLTKMGITDATVSWNLSAEELTKITVNNGQGQLTDTGALAIDTGRFTGRSPKDRFIVKDHITADAVWWGDINIPFEAANFDKLYNKMMSYLSGKTIYA